MMDVQIQNGWTKVRIAVAVNSKGEWVATGASSMTKNNGHADVTRLADQRELGAVDVHYVYALLPLAEHRVFEGTTDDA